LKKDNHQRKKQIHLESQSLNFLCQRFLQKKGCATKRILRGNWFINCQKQLTYLVCGKYVVQMFGSTSLSKIKLFIQKADFTTHIAKVNGEDKLIICCFALA